MRRRFLFHVMFAVGIVFMAVAGLEAQDCGTSCGDCGLQRYEGTNWAPFGQNNMNCVRAFWCNTCLHSVADGVPEASDLARALSRTAAEWLPTLVHAHGSRLYVQPDRGLVIVVGNACSEGSAEAVAFVSDRTIETLLELGIPTFSTPSPAEGVNVSEGTARRDMVP